MNALAALMTAIAAASAPSPGVFDQAEAKVLSAAASNEPQDVYRLARFYAGHALWPEALAALRRTPTLDEKAFGLAVEAEYRLGRYGAVIARLDDADAHKAFLAMALAHSGAYAEANRLFAETKPPAEAADLVPDYWLSRAEAAAQTNDLDAAQAALVTLARAKLSPADTARRHFVRGLALDRRNDRAASTRAFERAAALQQGAVSARAALKLAVLSGDIASLEALSLAWSGGAFERELQTALGRSLLGRRQFEEAFAALAGVVRRWPRSDEALDAQETLSRSLELLFGDDADLTPERAAKIFFTYVDFAPPGRDGDALIHAAADRLEALGLYRQAASLLDHQVFKRLRGLERSMVAADLAGLHMQARNADEALRVLRSTRIAGLSADIVGRRRQLEARALAAIGNADAAIALLAQAPSVSDLRLRADIEWAAGDWAAAARDYAAVFSAADRIATVDRTAAVRAATSFLLAGDRDGYRAFTQEASLRLEGTPEASMIRSLGDVDREAFLDRFMETYRAVYPGEAG